MRLTVRAEPHLVAAGDRVVLEVIAEAPQDVELELPVIDAALGAFAIREIRTPPGVVEDGTRRIRHRYELDTFAVGDQEIPPITVHHGDLELTTTPIHVTVESTLGDDQGLRDIRPAVSVPIGWGGWWWWFGGALLAVVAMGTFLAWWRGRAVDEKPEPEIAPDIWALAELSRLEAEDLVGLGRFSEFYFALSGIVRMYIERRFGLRAPERTTEEFLRETRSSRVLSEGHKGLLAAFLRAADMVKFARHEPSVPESRSALDSARGFVKQTRPAEAAA